MTTWGTLLRLSRAFTLLEVIAAVAIFGFGMVAVLGLYAPITKSVVTVADAEGAARVADAVRARLRAIPFEAAQALIQEADAVRTKDGLATYNPNNEASVLFGKRNGDVGICRIVTVNNTDQKIWFDSRNARLSDADKLFEVDLIRNDALTPSTADATAPYIAFIVRVRWPAFVQTSPTAAVQGAQNTGGSVPFDHGRKETLFFPGTISR